MFNCGGNVKGQVTLSLFDCNGKLKTRQEVTNKIVMTGCNMIASALAGDLQINIPSHLACGEGPSTPSLTDTALEKEVHRIPFDKPPLRTGNSIEFEATFGPGVPNVDNVAITEVGMFNAKTGGEMLNRASFAVVNKAIDDTVVINWVVTVMSEGE